MQKAASSFNFWTGGGPVKHAVVLLASISLIVGSEAQAQNWKATTEPARSNRGSCPTTSATYEFAITGAELSVKAPSGHIHRGQIGQDGTVSLQYASAAAAAGQISIFGNARSKQLQVVASSAPACIYVLVAEGTSTAAVAPSAYQGTVGDWALGQWNGQIVRNYQGTSLLAHPRSLIVARMPDGRIGRRWGETQFVGVAGWAPKCTIDATTVSLTSAENSFVELTRGASNRLEGRVREADANLPSTAFLTR